MHSSSPSLRLFNGSLLIQLRPQTAPISLGFYESSKFLDGKRWIEGRCLTIECGSIGVRQWLAKDKSWILQIPSVTLKTYDYVLLAVDGKIISWDDWNSIQGSDLMSPTNQSSNGAAPDSFEIIRNAALKLNTKISIITMDWDTPIHSSHDSTPFPSVSYGEWVRRNREGHFEEELKRYKQAIDNAAQMKTPIHALNFDKPDLTGFTYRAIHLLTQKEIECCVNVWGATDREGTEVRVVHHVHNPIFVDTPKFSKE